jgi:limonene 1,2-monooxygenase
MTFTLARMKFGLFLQPFHHPSDDPTDALHRDLDLIAHLDSLGFAEAWIGEHHSTGWENIAAPEVFIAAAAERTNRIRFGTGVVQLGLHHPLVVLDRMIMLDHLTRGRVTFGMGVGGGIPSDLTVFGLSKEAAGVRMEESIDVMMRLLEEDEPVSVTSDWFELKDTTLQLRPYTEPHMPFAVASTHRPNVEFMGRTGGKVLMGPLPGRVPEVFENLQRGAEPAGKDASRDQIELSYMLHVAETRDNAMEAFREGAIRERYEFVSGVNGTPEPDGSPEDWYAGYVESNLIGSPADVIEKIESIQEESGGIGGMIFMTREWAGIEANRESWRIFAEEVAPKFA